MCFALFQGLFLDLVRFVSQVWCLQVENLYYHHQMLSNLEGGADDVTDVDFEEVKEDK